MSYYDLLGISSSATAQEIKSAYRKMALKYHPDMNKSANATERFQEIMHAYSVLRDPAKRYAYDNPVQQKQTASYKSEPKASEPKATRQYTQYKPKNSPTPKPQDKPSSFAGIFVCFAIFAAFGLPSLLSDVPTQTVAQSQPTAERDYSVFESMFSSSKTRPAQPVAKTCADKTNAKFASMFPGQSRHDSTFLNNQWKELHKYCGS